MKQLFLSVALLASSIAFSQELKIDKVDDFTGSVVKKTKYYQIASDSYGALYVSLARVDDDNFIEFWTTSDLGCGGALGNYIILLYKDGSRKEFREDLLDISCEDRASSMYQVTLDDLQGATRVRIKQSEHYQDFQFDGVYTVLELFNAVQ
jgi:hypothetical protein